MAFFLLLSRCSLKQSGSDISKALFAYFPPTKFFCAVFETSEVRKRTSVVAQQQQLYPSRQKGRDFANNYYIGGNNDLI